MTTYRRPVARTAEREAGSELRIKGSRFVGALALATDEQQALAWVAERRKVHLGATHLCWALRIGEPARERSSDAGEPAGTAGAPMLRALAGAGVSDVVAVVARWFGGIKLGKGGLARAYGDTVRAALAELEAVEWAPSSRLRIEHDYSAEGAVKRVLHGSSAKIIGQIFTDTVRSEIEVFDASRGSLIEALIGVGCRVERSKW